MVNIKKGDQVKVLAGRDRGKLGKVLEVLDRGDRVIVEGVNLVTRHQRPRRSREKGQKLVKPSSLDVSKVMIVCSNCGKPTRLGVLVTEAGERTRICKRCKRAL